MSNRLRARTGPARPSEGPATRADKPVAEKPEAELPKAKLSWVLGVLVSVLLLAAAVAAFSMWLILRKH